jgi:hypothetical protein
MLYFLFTAILSSQTFGFAAVVFFNRKNNGCMASFYVPWWLLWLQFCFFMCGLISERIITISKCSRLVSFRRDLLPYYFFLLNWFQCENWDLLVSCRFECKSWANRSLEVVCDNKACKTKQSPRVENWLKFWELNLIVNFRIKKTEQKIAAFFFISSIKLGQAKEISEWKMHVQMKLQIGPEGLSGFRELQCLRNTFVRYAYVHTYNIFLSMLTRL